MTMNNTVDDADKILYLEQTVLMLLRAKSDAPVTSLLHIQAMLFIASKGMPWLAKLADYKPSFYGPWSSPVEFAVHKLQRENKIRVLYKAEEEKL
jgi:uncharacterized protein YwgA